MSTSTPIPLTSTGPYAGPPLDMDQDDLNSLGDLGTWLPGVAVPATFSPQLVDGDLDFGPPGSVPGIAASIPSLVDAALQNVFRWSSLLGLAPFLINLADRLTDAHLEAVLRAIGIYDRPDTHHVLEASHAEGGLAAALRKRARQAPAEFQSELARATTVLGYFGSVIVATNDGHAPPPAPAMTDSAAGCVFGAAALVGGSAIVVVAAAKEVGTAGAATPAALLTGALGVAIAGGGVTAMSTHCFS
jgi:hypothetical protein